jgi:hypothetical protein
MPPSPSETQTGAGRFPGSGQKRVVATARFQPDVPAVIEGWDNYNENSYRDAMQRTVDTWVDSCSGPPGREAAPSLNAE